MLRRLIAACLLLATMPAAAHADEPTVATTTATLTILSGSVQLIRPGADHPEVAEDGANLQTNDRIITGTSDRALVTFLDGTTITVEPSSDIVVQQADVNESGGGSIINIRINLGTVWARVVRLVDPGPTVSLSSSTATAVVHDGLPGAQKRLDGTFQCWTFSGELEVTGPDGSSVILQPQQTVVSQLVAPIGVAQPIHFNVSKLQITTAGSVLPLLEMPDGVRVAGFVAPDIEVNQVFASRTGSDGEMHVVEVPGGEVGPFTVVLQGVRDGPFSVDIHGIVEDGVVYSQRLSGRVSAGDRLVTTISQQLADAPSAADPRTAVILSGSPSPLTPYADPLPGKVVISPFELRVQ
jgi:hypothetical protein